MQKKEKKVKQTVPARSAALIELGRRATALWLPPPALTVSQWADRERMLSPESSAEPGRWVTSRAEYLREVMDAVADEQTQRVVCIKSVQVGFTEMLANTAAFYICEDPCPILMIQPTVEAAEGWSKERLAPMIRDTPALAAKVSDPKGRDTANTIRQKKFPGGQLTIVGANAPAGLASRPIRVVLADEVDKYPVSAGTEGNPLALASKRQATFWNRKTLVGSTPTIKGASEIEYEWEHSDKRRYHVPCPDCGHEQPLRWENVKWDKPDGEHDPQSALYMCESCGTLWNDVQRCDAVRRGRWVAEKPFRGVAGFHIPAFLSPWVMLPEVVAEFLQVRNDPERLKTWVNTVLGETWEDRAEKVDASNFMARRENYGPDSLPDKVQLLTAGVDVQGDRLEMMVIGWCANEESYVVAHQVIPGDPAQKHVWDMLDGLLAEQFYNESGRERRIRAVCIDEGGHYAAEVLDFCKPRLRRRVFAIKGASGPRPIWPKWATRTKQNDKVFVIGVDTAKDTIYARLRIAVAGENKPYVHFPIDDAVDQRFFDQLTSEQVLTRYKEGRPYRVWVLPSGKRNEVLDCFVYALAARSSIPVRLRAPAAAPTAPVPETVARAVAIAPAPHVPRLRKPYMPAHI